MDAAAVLNLLMVGIPVLAGGLLGGLAVHRVRRLRRIARQRRELRAAAEQRTRWIERT